MLNMSTVIEQKTAYSKTLYLKWVKSFWREMIETEIDSGCFILFSCFFGWVQMVFPKLRASMYFAFARFAGQW